MKSKETGEMPKEFFVARQPIFDQDEKLWGFELLFRKNLTQNYADINDPEAASVDVASCGFLQATSGVSSSLKIFINFTQRLIFDRFPLALPAATTVVEILEDIPVCNKLIERLIELKDKGYIIALDDFTGSESYRPILPLIDIIKLDCYGKDINEILSIKQRFSDTHCLFLAEKVESEEMFKVLLSHGVTFFQGYYFAKPQILTGKKLSTATTSRINLATEIEKTDFDIEFVIKTIQMDVSLSYRLLRYINSSNFSFRNKITSVGQSITLLGFDKLRHWLRLMLYSDMLSGNSNPELLRMALQRAHFLDQLVISTAPTDKNLKSLFLVGMFSLLDIILNTPMSVILENLPLSNELKSALLKENGPYSNYIHLAESIESLAFDKAQQCADALHIPGDVILESFRRAGEMADSLMTQIAHT